MDALTQMRRSAARLTEYLDRPLAENDYTRGLLAHEVAYLLAAALRLLPAEMGAALRNRMSPPEAE